jgi:hypothetical protein
VRALSGVFQASAVMAGAVLATRLLLAEAGVDPGIRLVAAVAVGIAVYVPCWFWRAGDAADELRLIRRHPRASAAAVTPPA